MAKLRSGRCYTTVKRPFTRKSRYREKSFVRGVPGHKIARFELGNRGAEFTHKIHLVVKSTIQLRHNCLEAARMATLKYLNEQVKRDNFHFILRVYPHQVLRENKIMSGAGADRIASGMKAPYGKPTGVAARVKTGQEIITVRTNEANIPKVRQAYKLATAKLPTRTEVIVVKATVLTH